MIGLALKKGKEVGRKSVIPITFSLFYAGFEILFSFIFYSLSSNHGMYTLNKILKVGERHN